MIHQWIPGNPFFRQTMTNHWSLAMATVYSTAAESASEKTKSTDVQLQNNTLREILHVLGFLTIINHY